MRFAGMWRGTIGTIQPTLRPGSLEEFIRLMPEGVGIIPSFLDVRRGTVEEFQNFKEQVDEKVREFGELGVDVIHPQGAPPFMIQGVAGERDLVSGWEREYGVPIVTAPMTQVEAMAALGIRRIVGVTYFGDELNDMFAHYLAEAGFEVLSMDGMNVAFEEVGRLSGGDVYRHTRDAVLRQEGVEGVYMLGAGWRVLDVVEALESDLGIPVVHSIAARVWSLQRRLHVRQKVQGYGRLLSEMPMS